nr:MAG TPA: intron associated endonuclease [Caudoviricetes sp.]
MDNKQPKIGYGYIYKYTSPSGKSYIGQTIRSLRERAGHNGKLYKGSYEFYRAIKKYGFDNFEVEILAEVPKQQLDKAEIKYIQLFNTLIPNGYNISAGGQFIGKSRKTRKVYQYSAVDGSFIKEWSSHTEVIKHFGVTTPVLERCLLGQAFTQWGYCWSYLKMDKFPINERMVNPQEKKVEMYSLNGELLQTFSSIAEAARQTGCERSAIKRCCRGELHFHGGYVWKCTEILYEKKYNNTAKKVQQICPESNEIIQVFNSISQAAKSLGKETSMIRRVLNDEKRTAYGYRWKTA